MAAIAKFTNGKLCEEYAADVRFGLFESTKASKRRKLVAETDRMTYTGHNMSDSNSAPFYKYMLAVRDKDTGKIEVFNTDVFHMKPYWPDEDTEVDKESSKKSNLSFVEKRDLLTSEFGSSKKQRAMKSRLKNQISTEVLEQALTSAADTALNTTLNTMAIDVTDVQEYASVIPPFNKDAKDPADVYNIADLISASEQAVLEDACRPFIECTRQQIKEWEAKHTYSEYVLDHLHTLPIAEQARKDKAILLMYLHYMMQLFHLKGANFKKKDPFGSSKVPTTVKQKFLTTYTVQLGNRRALPDRLKDMLVTNMFVVCLFIDQFCMNLNLLQKDLKIGEKKLLNFCLALGCKHGTSKVGENEVTKTIRLTVPLEFPTARLRRKTKTH